MQSKERKKFIASVYLIISLIGVIFFILSYFIESRYWEAVFINFSISLISVVFIFFLINYFLVNDEMDLIDQNKLLISQLKSSKVISASEFFSSSFIPHNVNEINYENAKNVYISGYSLSRITRLNTTLFISLLEKGVNLNFLMLDYKNNEVLNQIVKRTTSNYTKVFWKNRLIEGETLIKILNSPKITGKINFGLHTYVPGFGQLIIERHNGNNDCYIILYPHESGHVEPAFKVNNGKDEFWYNFFYEQFKLMWDSSKKIKL